jgi:death-on-curing protein
MVGNHGFVDGNKRTAVILVNILVERSGYEIVPADAVESINQAVEDLVVAAANGDMSLEEIVAWFRARLRGV